MSRTAEDKSEAGGAAPEPTAKAEGPPRGLLREYFESGVVTIIMALFFMTFVAQAAEVPSASMENTILVGDRFLINKFIFAPGPPTFFLPQREIRRGDILVFKYPAESIPRENIVQYETLFIKRVIGLPGETIQVRGADVYINDQRLPEQKVVADDPDLGNDKDALSNLSEPAGGAGGPYKVFYPPEAVSPGAEGRPVSPDFRFGVGKPYQVPAGHYFVMGDNRSNSADSRVWGPVPRELVVGRGLFVIWSYNSSLPRSNALPPFNLLSDLISNTRWNRIGTSLR
ncbi:MAG TPA: signal peptidase I [Pyrinomonadaceae bacterium]|nr:signal peptidase I [Pyrinomonadaceae bacterium]